MEKDHVLLLMSQASVEGLLVTMVNSTRRQLAGGTGSHCCMYLSINRGGSAEGNELGLAGNMVGNE